MGKLSIVGIGPGNDQHLTPKALESIQGADHVIGYTTYIRLVKNHIRGKTITRTGMSEEIGRAKAAIEMAKEGNKVALISSGDAGIYGMAGLVFDVLKEMGWKKGESPEIEIVPGITAASSCASRVGAPLIHDSCTISLSDLLTPWPVIEKRIEHAALSDFVISFYNPASGRRQRQIVEAQRILKKYRPGTTPVALVKSGYRKRENIILSDLDNFLDFEIGMLTTVIVGSTQTYIYEGYMVTPRGHQNKYELKEGNVKSGQRKTFSLRCDGDLQSKIEGEKDAGVEVKLAKTYQTPTENWVTPKDTADVSFLDKNQEEDLPAPPTNNGVDSAREALAALKKTSFGKNKLEGLSQGEKTIREIPPFKEGKDSKALLVYDWAGALIFKHDDRVFLVGDFKSPPESVGKNQIEFFKEKEEGEFIRSFPADSWPKEARPLFLWEGEGIAAACDLYLKFAIYRNHSIGRRTTSKVTDTSKSFRVGEEVFYDGRWLAHTPQEVWNMVREELLKC